MLVSKEANICVTPKANPQREGSPMQNFTVGHVDFMLVVLILFSLQWNMGFKDMIGVVVNCLVGMGH